MIDLRIDADTGVIRREAGLATPDALIAVTAVRHGIP
jgi:predicted nucleic acid-binding protein